MRKIQWKLDSVYFANNRQVKLEDVNPSDFTATDFIVRIPQPGDWFYSEEIEHRDYVDILNMLGDMGYNISKSSLKFDDKYCYTLISETYGLDQCSVTGKSQHCTGDYIRFPVMLAIRAAFYVDKTLKAVVKSPHEKDELFKLRAGDYIIDERMSKSLYQDIVEVLNENGFPVKNDVGYDKRYPCVFVSDIYGIDQIHNPCDDWRRVTYEQVMSLKKPEKTQEQPLPPEVVHTSDNRYVVCMSGWEITRDVARELARRLGVTASDLK